MHLYLTILPFLLFTLIPPFSRADDGSLVDQHDQNLYINPLPVTRPPPIQFRRNYTCSLNISDIENIVFQLQLNLGFEVKIPDSDWAVIVSLNSTATTIPEKINRFATLVTLSVNNIESQIANFLGEYRDKLQEVRSKLREAADDFRSVVDSFRDTDGLTTVQAVLYSQKLSLQRKLDQTRGLLVAIRLAHSAILQTILDAANKVGILSSTSLIDDVTHDIVYFLQLKSILEGGENKTVEFIHHLQDQLDDISDRIESAANHVVRAVDDIIDDLRNKTHDVSGHIRDNLILSHPMVIDASVTTKVNNNSASLNLDVELSIDPTVKVDADVLLTLVKGSVAVAINVEIDAVCVVSSSQKRSLFHFTVTITTPVVSVSVDLAGSLSGTIDLFALPIPLSSDEMKRLRLDLLLQWFDTSLNAKASDIQNWLSKLDAELKDNDENETESEGQYNSTHEDLEHGMNILKDDVDRLRKSNNSDYIAVGETVILNRIRKLSNTLAQYHAYLQQQRYLFHRTQSTVFRLKIRILQLILNGTLNAGTSVNCTAFQLLTQTYISWLNYNHTLEALLDQKDDIEAKIKAESTVLSDRLDKVKQQIRAKYDDIKTQVYDGIKDFRKWLKSDIEDFLNGSLVLENETRAEVNEVAHEVNVYFRIWVDAHRDDIYNSIMNALIASTGAPSISIHLDISVSSTKRDTSSTVTATISGDATTTTTPTPSGGQTNPTPSGGQTNPTPSGGQTYPTPSPKSMGTSIELALSLLLLVITTLMLL